MGAKSFLEGGISCVVAGCSTHPLDLIKVRLQLHGESPSTLPSLSFHNSPKPFLQTTSFVPKLGPISLAVNIVKSEGAAGLYSGVSATLLRQSLYSTTAMGLYEVLKNKWCDPESGKRNLTRKIAAGLVAGGIGAAVGNPADVAMVRMQGDGRLPLAQRRNYAGVGDAIRKMVKQEGVLSLWRGSALTINRAMIVTAAQLASYDEFKEAIIGRGLMSDWAGTHVVASIGAGFVAAVASNPVDVIKTRVMNMKVEGNGGVAAPYKGAWDCAMKTVRAEGPTALYKGFVPTVCRQGPFTIVLFVTLEQVRKLLRDF